MDMKKVIHNVKWNKLLKISINIGLQYRDRRMILCLNSSSNYNIENQDKEVSTKKRLKQG